MCALKTTQIAFVITASLILNGCATQSSSISKSDSTSNAADLRQVCSPIVLGVGAALLCGALASGKNRVRTGAACAAVAVTGCYLANSYSSRQTRTGEQVQDDYVRQNRQLPERAMVTAYRSDVIPRGAVSRGQEIRLTSTIVAVPGRNDRSILIEEEVGVVDGRGETWGSPVRKTANNGNQSGEFQTSFVIPVTDGMSQGTYYIKRSLYVNGAVVQRDNADARFQVVMLEENPRSIRSAPARLANFDSARPARRMLGAEANV